MYGKETVYTTLTFETLCEEWNTNGVKTERIVQGTNVLLQWVNVHTKSACSTRSALFMT